MKGYKIFVKYKGKWAGLHYQCPEDWKIRAGSVLEVPYVNDDNDIVCAEGIHFWTSKKEAFEAYGNCWCSGLGIAVYEIQTLEKCYGKRKAGKLRTRKLKLVRRLKSPRKELS